MRIMKKWPKYSKDFWQALFEFHFENGDLEKTMRCIQKFLMVLISLVMTKISYSKICDVIIDNFPHFH